jgi:hypothetical protein
MPGWQAECRVVCTVALMVVRQALGVLIRSYRRPAAIWHGREVGGGSTVEEAAGADD